MLSYLDTRPRKTTQLEERHLGASTRTMDVAVAPPANLQPPSLYTFASAQAARLARLAPAHFYWDYLPDLVQTQIMKMVHKQLWKSVNVELLELLICANCSRHFDDWEEMEYHWDLYWHPVDEER